MVPEAGGNRAANRRNNATIGQILEPPCRGNAQSMPGAHATPDRRGDLSGSNTSRTFYFGDFVACASAFVNPRLRKTCTEPLRAANPDLEASAAFVLAPDSYMTMTS